MKRVSSQELKSIIYDLGEQKSVITEAEILATGASKGEIEKLVQSGVLYPSAKGIYLPENADFTEQHTRVEVAARFPEAVICLASALRFHEITTQLPSKVWIALPQDSPDPDEPSLPIEVVYMPEEIYAQGIETHILEGIPVKIYNLAKTVVDCFDFQSEIGLDVAMEAVEECWRTAKCSLNEIKKYAKIRDFDSLTQADFDEALTHPEKIFIFI